ncbi:type VII secretion-associated serine protease mycosin [Mycobacterium deserti]|uniref:Type VII secretion-associated serine protease mycosin n=1 Tax=Mycobacterium deserti TaxID=2978347 RepID=A0ABT2M774_9MYCO|nr:type VII secretion-associated serine protease mycosin [Mycobacterium deserti]MCT7658118.1 type VII secretion-associated serine protease mycosin [Mycobacterium deserti]
MTAAALGRLVGVAALAGLPLLSSPAASAAPPPAVDGARLPPPASPAPPQRTERQEPCVTSDVVAGRSEGQIKDADLQRLWQLTRGAGQTVAVIDTGVTRHRLLPHLLSGGDYVSTSDGTEDCDGHGTIVAGIIGAAPDADDAYAFSGIAPHATLIAIRQSSTKFRAVDDLGGSGYGDVETLAMAVRTAADMGATVINVSSVACVPARDELDDRPLGAALAYAVDVKNVVVVTAAGNVGTDGQCPEQNPAADPTEPGRPNWTDVNTVVSPAWYDDYVLTVGSIGSDGKPSKFSLGGPWVDVAAPGENVVSLDPDGEGLVDTLPTAGGEKAISGTSYAAPVVTGVVALVRARSPELTARQVMQLIEDTARRPPDNWNPFVGHGVVDALAAVSAGRHTHSADVEPIRMASIPATAEPDDRSGHIAIRGAAICLAMTAAVIAAMTSARLRRRPDAHD